MSSSAIDCSQVLVGGGRLLIRRPDSFLLSRGCRGRKDEGEREKERETCDGETRRRTSLAKEGRGIGREQYFRTGDRSAARRPSSSSAAINSNYGRFAGHLEKMNFGRRGRRSLSLAEST